MLRVDVRLDFSCCVCGNPVGASLRCQGIGLAEEQPYAAVPLECPHCGTGNYLVFSPHRGEVHEVSRMWPRRHSEVCPN